MARIKLTMPPGIIAHISIPVRITDINYGNHLGNDALVSLIHESRMQWLIQNNYSELDIGGTSLIMSDLAVEYVSESFYGDILEVTLAAGEVSRAGFELYYQFQVTRNDAPFIIARAKTGMVCYDYSAKKVALLPEKFRALLMSNKQG